ncbi:uncharacterized protein LOC134853073 isoform X2 [Symsagittifera roscoffensis]|uniref:uncharacterized protein LOC134853073 isoform X2 n=1 Tax=Symsagittifera roscoffensis TaxID=84072 RepID=UPI00307C5FA5
MLLKLLATFLIAGVVLCDEVEQISGCDKSEGLSSYVDCLSSEAYEEDLKEGYSYDFSESGDCGWCVNAMTKLQSYLANREQDYWGDYDEQPEDASNRDEEYRMVVAHMVCAQIEDEKSRNNCEQLTFDQFYTLWEMQTREMPTFKVCSIFDYCHVTFDVCKTSPKTVCADYKTATKCGMFAKCMKHEWVAAAVEWSPWSTVDDHSAECTECKMVVDYMKSYLADYSHRNEIIHEVEMVCEKFFTADECETYVGESIGTLLELLDTEVSADEICSLLQLCSSSQDLEPATVQPGTASPTPWSEEKVATPPPSSRGLLGADECVSSLEVICSDPELMMRCERGDVCDTLKYGYTFGSAKFGHLLSSDKMPEWPELSGTENCEECENFMKYVKGYFSDEETHREAEVAVEKWCNDLPSEYSAECVQMVQEYLPILFTVLEEHLDPETVCHKWPPCSADQSSLNETQTDCAGTLCTPEGCCPLTDAVCCSDNSHCCPHGYSCSSDGGYCMQSGEENQKSVESFGLTLTKSKGKFESYATFPKISECTLCEEIVVWAKEYLSEEGTTDEIEDAAKEMCNELPSGYVDECLEVVNGYLPLLIEALEQDLDPQTVCTEVDLCPDDSFKLNGTQTACVGTLCSPEACCPLSDAVCCSDNLHCCPHGYSCSSDGGYCMQSGEENKKSQPKVDQNYNRKTELTSYATLPKISECVVCEQLVGWAKEYLGEGGTTDEIEDAAKEMCNKLPSDYVDECLELVNGYLPLLIEALEQDLDPQTVCTEVKLCPDDSSKLNGTQTACVGTLCSPEACCPLSDAVCCSDKLHCCPHGYSCSSDGGYCMQSGERKNSKPEPKVEEKYNDVIKSVSRGRRQAEISESYNEQSQLSSWLTLGEKLAGMVDGLLGQLRESGACSACKLAVKYTRESDLRDMDEKKELYLDDIRFKVCKEMYGENYEACPLDQGTLENILEAHQISDMMADDEVEKDEDGLYCPVKALCDANSIKIEDAYIFVREHMCDVYRNMLELVNDPAKLNAGWSKLMEQADTLKGSYNVNGLQWAEGVKKALEQAQMEMEKEGYKDKKEILIKKLKEEVPSFQMC